MPLNAPHETAGSGQPTIVAGISCTPEQAVVLTGRSRTRIFKAIKEKELTARKDGKATLLEVEELRRWVRTFPTIGRQPVAA